MNLDYKAIGARVKNFRRERNLSQEKLAELVDVSVPYMSNIETGKKKLSMFQRQKIISLSTAICPSSPPAVPYPSSQSLSG